MADPYDASLRGDATRPPDPFLAGASAAGLEDRRAGQPRGPSAHDPRSSGTPVPGRYDGGAQPQTLDRWDGEGEARRGADGGGPANQHFAHCERDGTSGFLRIAARRGLEVYSQ